jgi:hypothetical protein
MTSTSRSLVCTLASILKHSHGRRHILSSFITCIHILSFYFGSIQEGPCNLTLRAYEGDISVRQEPIC